MGCFHSLSHTGSFKRIFWVYIVLLVLIHYSYYYFSESKLEINFIKNLIIAIAVWEKYAKYWVQYYLISCILWRPWNVSVIQDKTPPPKKKYKTAKRSQLAKKWSVKFGWIKILNPKWIQSVQHLRQYTNWNTTHFLRKKKNLREIAVGWSSIVFPKEGYFKKNVFLMLSNL